MTQPELTDEQLKQFRMMTPEEIEAREKRPNQVVFVLDLDKETDSYSIVSYGHWYPIYTQGETVKEALAMAIDFMECEEANDTN